jgi:hypothetical protein
LLSRWARAITAAADNGDTAASPKENVVLHFNSDNATLARHDGQLGSVFCRQTAYFDLGTIPEEQKLIEGFGAGA